MKDIDRANKSKKNIVAVALTINSPGGSAVHSSIAGNKLFYLSRQLKVPFFTFAENLAASGGYWLLCTGNLIAFFL
jgi:ClpP class serine protease